MTKPTIEEPPHLNDMFEAAKPELATIPEPTFVRRLATRERVVELTTKLLASWAEVAPMAEALIKAVHFAGHQERADRLMTRAWVFYAGDLAVGVAYSGEEGRSALAARVRAHDRRLMLWARAYFDGQAWASESLAEIARSHGTRDDAEDVVRLVAMFRNAAKAGAVLPVDEATLDAAEADAQEQLKLLGHENQDAARMLANQAYTAWYRDYDELLGLGRYLTRGQADSLSSFPGVRMPKGRQVAVEIVAAEGESAGEEEVLETGVLSASSMRSHKRPVTFRGRSFSVCLGCLRSSRLGRKHLGEDR